jgi:hypothetical protein
MAIIYSYPLNFNILDTDIVVGTSTKLVGGKKKNFTKSFSMLDIYGYIASNLDIQAPNLQEVTTTGNITTLDIQVNGLTIGRGNGSISGNTAIGDNALKNSLTGNSNTAGGFYSLFSNTDGNGNSVWGYNASFYNTIGNKNVSVGTQSLLFNTTGSNNTAIGSESGKFLANKTSDATILNNSVMLGCLTSPLGDNQSNQIVIGYNATGLGSNTATIGNTSITTTRLRGAVLGGSFVKDGGTNLQYLMADGSVSAGDSIIPTLQQVATAGNTTNLDININSLTVGKGSGTGTNNTAVGNLALNSNITGSNNTATGKDALSNNTSSNNTANGANTLRTNTSGDGNTAIGYQSLISNTTGRLNTGLGMQALVFNTTGVENVAVGFNALQFNATGINNTASGNSSLFSNTTGNNNTGVGYAVLGRNNVGSNNTALGFNAGGRISSSSSNIISNNSVFLGSETKALGNDQTNQIVIGHNAIGLGSNSIVLGNSLTIAAAIYGNLLLGTTSNNGVDKLQINGSLAATSIKKLNGTSSEFLMADGSVTTAVTPTIPTLQQVTTAGETTNVGIKVIGLEKYISVTSQDNETGAVTISTDVDGLPYIQLGLTANENTAIFRADDINTNSVYQLPNQSGIMALTSDIPAYVNNRLVIEETTGHTLTNADSGGIIIFKTTAAQTLNIPLGLDAGFECTFVTLAGITLTVPSVVGITLNNATGTTMAGGLSFTLKRMLATDTFIVTGNL